MMRILTCVSILAVVAAGIAVADNTVTGKWAGAFHSISPEGETRESAAFMILKQTGNDITGTAGPSENDQHLTLHGKIDGDKITLAADADGRAIRFDLVLAADRITGDMNMVHSGQTAKAKIDVTRVK